MRPRTLGVLLGIAVFAVCAYTGAQTTHVDGYYRKDGTYVQPHERRSAGTTDSTTSHSSATYSGIARDSKGHIQRSKSARNEFERENPCPSTGKTSGPCPGYVVDHVKPLECGGDDAATNMQWQTAADGKAKDKTERNCRQ
jgi:hypothetical protein